MAATSAGELPTDIADADDPGAQRLLTVLLRRYGIPVAESVTADCADSAVEAAWWLGFPVTLVADGTRLTVHAGITRCGLATPTQVRAAYRQLAASIGAAMTGVRVRRQPQQGAEVIVRVAREAAGTARVTLMLGGPPSALVGARVSRTAPLSARDARSMLEELHGTSPGRAGGPEPAEPTEDGSGSSPDGMAPSVPRAGGDAHAEAVPGEGSALDIAALAGLLERVGRLASAVPQVTELELNPVIVTGSGAAVAGVRGQFHRFPTAKAPRAPLRSVS